METPQTFQGQPEREIQPDNTNQVSKKEEQVYAKLGREHRLRGQFTDNNPNNLPFLKDDLIKKLEGIKLSGIGKNDHHSINLLRQKLEALSSIVDEIRRYLEQAE